MEAKNRNAHSEVEEMEAQAYDGNDDWEEQGATQFKFENAGDILEGVLIQVDAIEIDGKEAKRAIIEKRENGERYFILLTVQLEGKLAPLPNGTLVRIVFDGVETRKGGRRMFNFRVYARR